MSDTLARIASTPFAEVIVSGSDGLAVCEAAAGVESCSRSAKPTRHQIAEAKRGGRPK